MMFNKDAQITLGGTIIGTIRSATPVPVASVTTVGLDGGVPGVVYSAPQILQIGGGTVGSYTYTTSNTSNTSLGSPFGSYVTINSTSQPYSNMTISIDHDDSMQARSQPRPKPTMREAAAEPTINQMVRAVREAKLLLEMDKDDLARWCANIEKAQRALEEALEPLDVPTDNVYGG